MKHRIELRTVRLVSWFSLLLNEFQFLRLPNKPWQMKMGGEGAVEGVCSS